MVFEKIGSEIRSRGCDILSRGVIQYSPPVAFLAISVPYHSTSHSFCSCPLNLLSVTPPPPPPRSLRTLFFRVFVPEVVCINTAQGLRWKVSRVPTPPIFPPAAISSRCCHLAACCTTHSYNTARRLCVYCALTAVVPACPGIVGTRGSMAMRRRPCMMSSTPSPPTLYRTTHDSSTSYHEQHFAALTPYTHTNSFLVLSVPLLFFYHIAALLHCFMSSSSLPDSDREPRHRSQIG